MSSKKESFCAGIDLGTSNCMISVYRNGRPSSIPQRTGSFLLPSCYAVKIRDKSEVIGMSAKRMMAQNTYFGICNTKRVLGLQCDHERIKNFPLLCVAPIKPDTANEVLFYSDRLNMTFTPVDIAEKLLRELIDAATRGAGPIENIVVTVPDGFTLRQKECTTEAIERLGYTKDHYALLEEPIASAVEFVENDNGQEKKYVMFDVGGGTFDISIMSLKNHHIKVIGTSGIESIGGFSFDRHLAETIDKQLFKLYGKKILDCNNDRLKSKFVKACEMAKEQLSTLNVFDIELGDFDAVFGFSEQNIEPDEVSYKVTRAEFNIAIEKDIDACIRCMDECLKEYNFKKDDISAVIMIGGSTRIPYIRSRVESYFNRNVIKQNVNCDEVVCKGACYYCQNKYFDSKLSFVIDEVVTHDIGIKLADGIFHTVIKRGEPVCKKTYYVCITTPNYNNISMITTIYRGNRQENYQYLKDIVWSGFPEKRNYLVQFILSITLLASRTIAVEIIDRRTKQVYYPRTEINFYCVCMKQVKNRDNR